MRAFFTKPWNRCYQYLATLSGSCLLLACGANIGWTSPYLPQILNGLYPELSMTPDEGSWCAVMPLIGAPAGSISTIFLIDRIGRVKTVLTFAPIVLAMYITLALARTPFIIYLVRFVIGSVEGGLYVSLPIYFGEIAEPSIRGILTATVPLSATFGILLINVLGVSMSIFASSLACCIIPIVHFCTFIWMPESPYYLLKKGKLPEAKRSLKLLRGNSSVDQELQSMNDAVLKQENKKRGSFVELFTVKSNRRALTICVVLILIKKFSGKNPIMFYTRSIFEKADSPIDPAYSAIIFIGIYAIANLLALLFLDRMGRRPVLIVSCLGSAIALAIVGGYFFIKVEDFSATQNLKWIPLAGMLGYNIFYSFGLEVTPTVFFGELFPTSVKGVALSMCDSVSVVNGVLASKLFQVAGDAHGDFLPFWLFAGCCFVGLIFVIKCVPETKNKSLEEIQQDLKR